MRELHRTRMPNNGLLMHGMKARA